MKDKHFIVTRDLVEVKNGTRYLKSEQEIKDILDELLAMAEIDNMQLVSTFRTEYNILFIIFINK